MRKPIEVVSLSFLDLLSIALGGVTLMVVMLSLSLKPGRESDPAHFLVVSLRFEVELDMATSEQLEDLIESGSLPPLRLVIDGGREIEFDPRDSGVRSEDFGDVRWVVEVRDAHADAGKATAAVTIYCICTAVRRQFEPTLTIGPQAKPRIARATCAYSTRDRVGVPAKVDDERAPRVCTLSNAADLFPDLSRTPGEPER